MCRATQIGPAVRVDGQSGPPGQLGMTMMMPLIVLALVVAFVALSFGQGQDEVSRERQLSE